jgi:hypothetical protein
LEDESGKRTKRLEVFGKSYTELRKLIVQAFGLPRNITPELFIDDGQDLLQVEDDSDLQHFVPTDKVFVRGSGNKQAAAVAPAALPPARRRRTDLDEMLGNAAVHQDAAQGTVGFCSWAFRLQPRSLLHFFNFAK